jgi:hypothetical protein
LEDVFTCTICHDLYQIDKGSNKIPKTLPCQHVYCLECVHKWLTISVVENKRFDCPQCKQKVDVSIKSADQLPTSRLIANLIEKGLTHFHGVATCPKCKQTKLLEVCFECAQPLCHGCIKDDFIEWKRTTNTNLFNHETLLKTYLDNMSKSDAVAKNGPKQIDMYHCSDLKAYFKRQAVKICPIR